jgi:septum formation protein
VTGSNAIDLVLASTSRYRRELLARIAPAFRCVAPAVDETAMPDEAPSALATRLAAAKATAVAVTCPGCIVIGSDQVASVAGRVLGKPGSAAAARDQLAASSGRSVDFMTAVCVIDTRGDGRRLQHALDITHVRFRHLDGAEIARYVEREQALDCAGSFKAEGLGIALFERIDSTDPTALIGLPLIALATLLRGVGMTIP